MSRRTTRSDRNTGAWRDRRGSGPVGRLPMNKSRNPHARRRTKPLVQGKHTTPAYHDAVLRGRRKIVALLERAHRRYVRVNPITAAVRRAISGREL